MEKYIIKFKTMKDLNILINAIKEIDAPLSVVNYKKMIRRLLKENN